MSPNTVGKILDKFRNANANRVGVGVGEKAPVYKVGDNSGNGGNGDARARATTTNPQQQILQPEQQQAMITMPLPTPTITTTTGLTAEVKSLSDNEKAAIAYKLYDEGKRPVDIISMLLISAEEAMEYYHKFWKLNRDYEFYHAYHEMKPYLPSLLRLHSQLKRHGLTNRMRDIDYFVSVMETEAFKLPEFEAELSDMETKLEAARNEFLATRREKLDMLYQLRNEKRLLENDIQSEKKNLSDLKEAQGQIQRTFDFLIHKTANVKNKYESAQQIAAKFRRTNKNYVKIKEVAEDHINSVLVQEDKAKLLSIALNSVVEAFRQNPDACANVVFTDNNGNNRNNNGSGSNDGDDDIIGYGDPTTSSIAVYNSGVPPNTNASANNNTDEYRNGLLMLAKHLFNTFMSQITNQTMNTLEAEKGTEEDTEE
jgi:hypothetical protein